MRNLALALVALVPLVLLLVLVLALPSSFSRGVAEAAVSIAPASAVRSDAEASGVQALEERLASLTMEVRRLSSELARLATERVPAGQGPAPAAAPAAAPSGGASITPEWYLEQYVLSFQSGGEGSEYFRLAVDAYSALLLEEIAVLVLDPAAHPVLRVRLIEMLGNPRFQGSGRALDVLLRVLRSARDGERLRAALFALVQIGDAALVPTLEGLVWSLPTADLQRESLTLLVGLAGARANETLARLLLSAPDSDLRAYVITLLQAGDALLEAFRIASGLEQPVRLQAAQAIGSFHDEALLAFVDEWSAFETDPDVRAALSRSREEISAFPGWHAMQATGPPDADPNRDDPKAWASRSPDMGEQWLELTYDVPRTAFAVRVFEVNVPGAVARVVGVDGSGGRHTLWSGSDPTQTGGLFEIQFPTTGFAVQRIVLFLDTSRRSGWNEIDAVELVGPQGSSWASRATASSTYGQ